MLTICSMYFKKQVIYHDASAGVLVIESILVVIESRLFLNISTFFSVSVVRSSTDLMAWKTNCVSNSLKFKKLKIKLKNYTKNSNIRKIRFKGCTALYIICYLVSEQIDWFEGISSKVLYTSERWDCLTFNCTDNALHSLARYFSDQRHPGINSKGVQLCFLKQLNSFFSQCRITWQLFESVILPSGLSQHS